MPTNPNDYCEQQRKSGHLCSLMRRINYIENTGRTYSAKANWPVGFSFAFGIGSSPWMSAVILANDGYVYALNTNASNTISYAEKFDTSGNHISTTTLSVNVVEVSASHSYLPHLSQDSSGNFYVSYRVKKGTGSLASKCVAKFNSSWTFQSALIARGTGASECQSCIAVYDRDLDIFFAISGDGTQGLKTFDTSGTYIETLCIAGTGDGEVTSPIALCVDSSYVYVVDGASTKRIQKINKATGAHVLSKTITSYGSQACISEAHSTNDILVASTNAIGRTHNVLQRYGKNALNLRITAQESPTLDFTACYIKELSSGIIILGYQGFLWFIAVSSHVAAAQTEFNAYRSKSAISLGTPDGGISIPSLNGLSEGFPADANGYTGAQCVPNNLTDLRDAIEALVASNHLQNPATSTLFNWANGSANNLYYVAMGDRTKYGATGGAKYDWTRDVSALEYSGSYDIDIGELFECIETLEAANIV